MKVKLVKYSHTKLKDATKPDVIITQNFGHGKYQYDIHEKDGVYLGFVQYNATLPSGVTEITSKENLITYLETIDGLRNSSGQFISASDEADNIWIDNVDWTYS